MESHEIQQSRRKSTGHGILKQPSGGLNNQLDKDHIKFDEEIIAEHDKSRGTRQKISEPKTPYANDDLSDSEQQDVQLNTDVRAGGNHSNHHNQDVDMHDHTVVHVEGGQVVEEEVKKHLEEAERNKQLNAQLQKEQAMKAGGVQVSGSSGGSNFNDQLMQRLDNTQQELDEEERKHQEFLKRRKEHYKNEMKAAQLLKSKSQDEDEDDE